MTHSPTSAAAGVGGWSPTTPVTKNREPAAPPPASDAARAATPQPQLFRSPPTMLRTYFQEAAWTLHAQPTAYVVLGSMVMAMAATYVLSRHILSTKDHVGVFLMGSYVIFASYFMVYFYLEKLSTSFHRVSHDKKFYTISNLIKAGVLAAITPFGAYELYHIVVYDQWNGNTLRNLGCIYAIPDFVSLILVRRMSYTTIAHHVCVCVFNYFSVQNDYANENVCRLIVVYAAFSTFAYVVNMLLASRFLGVNANVVRVLSVAALLVYATCCAINWTWQAAYLRSMVGGPNDHWTLYAYMVLISFVMWDDLVLMRWLLGNARGSPQDIDRHEAKGPSRRGRKTGAQDK